MSLTKKLVLGLGLLVAIVALVVVVGGLLSRSTWRVERSITIAAAPAMIAPFLGDLHEWQKWAAWNKVDPKATWTYSGAPRGVRSVMSWKGDVLGSGSLTIVSDDPARGITYEMTMEGGTPAKGAIVLEEVPGGTRTTWSDSGDMGDDLPGRLFIPSLEKALGAHFEAGLRELEAVAEKAERDANPAPAPN